MTKWKITFQLGGEEEVVVARKHVFDDDGKWIRFLDNNNDNVLTLRASDVKRIDVATA